MHSLRAFSRQVVVMAAIILLSLAAACSKPGDKSAAGKVPAPTAREYFTPMTKTRAKLGDLSEFRNIAADIESSVEKGDLAAARTRIKDLEVAWDSAEAGLKPRAANDWHVLDKAVDRALSVLRGNVSSQADCLKVITELVQVFDSPQGKN